MPRKPRGKVYWRASSSSFGLHSGYLDCYEKTGIDRIHETLRALGAIGLWTVVVCEVETDREFPPIKMEL